MGAHRGIEHRKWVFVRLQVPEGRNVGLAMEFLEDEPLYGGPTFVMGNLVIPHGPNSRGGFCEVFRSDSSLSDSGRLVNLRKWNMSVLELPLKFPQLAHHVSDLVSIAYTKIHRFVLGLGGACTDRREAVVILTFWGVCSS